MNSKRASSVVAALIVAVVTVAGCTVREGPPSIAGPSAAAISTLAATSSVTITLVPDILHRSEEFESEVAALMILIDALPPAQSPDVRSLLGAVQSANGYEFLIGQMGRLIDGDHKEALQLLRGALEQLKAFKNKLEDGLTNDTWPDDIRRAAEAPLETSDQLQSLILLALGCTEAPC